MLILAAALALATQGRIQAAPPRPEPYRPAPATIVAEPVALFIAGADRDADSRTTLAEFRRAVLEATSADPPWRETGDTGIGYIQYSDWSLRWLGDRNAVPTPFDVDRNGDNRLTVAEFSERMEAIFTRLDADKDGAVTRAELLTVRPSPVGSPERYGRRRRDRRER